MKLIMHAEPVQTSKTPEPTTNFRVTPRPNAIRILRRALEAGDIIDFTHTTLRYLKKGQKFEEGDQPYQALETGCFLKLAVWEHGHALDQPPSSYSWGFLPGNTDEVIASCLDQVSPYQQECLVVNAVYRNLSRIEAQERAARREGVHNAHSQADNSLTRSSAL